MANTFNIYIRHWKKADGTTDSGSEKLMFSVPQSDANGFPVLNPTVKCGEDAADSLDFNMNAGMAYYDSLTPLVTMLRVEYYGNTIFYGRVLTVNASTVMQTKAVHCEGAFGFLNDSYYPATADSKREDISWSTYFDRLLSSHNSYINGNDLKKFSRGTVDFTPASKNKKFEPTGWTQTSSALSSLKDELGGHMLARYTGGYNYIDWYKYHRRDLGDGNRPVVRVGENIIDISSNMDVGNLFTRVIPVGKSTNDGTKITIQGYGYTDRNGTNRTHGTNYMPVSLIRTLYADSELNNGYHTPADFDDSESKYGIIYKTVQFSDAGSAEELWNECKKWIKESFYGAVTSFEIRAIDMHIQNTSLPLILLGDCVDIYYRVMENGQMATKYRKMIAKSVKYDLFNPSNNTYSFGIPSDLLKTSKSQQSSSSSKKTASGSVSTPNIDIDEGPDMDLTFQKIADIIRKDPDVENGYGGDAAADSFIANGKLSGSVNVYDADIHYDPIGHPEICFTGQIVGKITLSGKSVKWVALNNAHGLFAYLDISSTPTSGNPAVVAAIAAANANVARPTSHWYIKARGYTYTDFSVWQSAALTGSVMGTIAAAEGIVAYAGANSIIQMLGDTVNAAAVSSVQGAVNAANTMAMSVKDKVFSIFKGEKDSSGNDIPVAQMTGGENGGGLSIFEKVGKKIIEASGKDKKLTLYDTAKSQVSAQVDAAIGSVNAILGKFGKDGTGNDTTVDISGTNAFMKFFSSNGISATETASLLGDSGSLFNKVLKLGTDGTGNNSTINMNGVSSILSLINPDNPGSTSSADTTVEVKGSDGGKGTFGKNASNGWRVSLNEKVTYTDKDNVTHTLEPGFVVCEDMKIAGLETIPSFRTKLAVVDTLIAGKVNATEISADLAYIRDLKGDTIKANRYVRAGYGYFTNIYGSNIYGTSHIYRTIDGNNVDLGRCYNQCLITEKDGEITLTMYPADGTNPIEGRDKVTFSMADTTFYKNAVSAATNSGFDADHQMFITGAGSDDKISTATLNPGDSKNYYPTFKKKGSGYQYGSLVKVTARSLNLQAKSVAPSTSAQTITADSGRDGLSSVNVSAAVRQAKICTPSASQQEITYDAGYYGLSKVTVSGDSNLTAGNIKSGVSIFGVTGTYAGYQRALYIAPDFSARYGNNYTFKSYTQKDGTQVDSVGGGSAQGVYIPLIEAGASGSDTLTDIPSTGITANGNYKAPSSYMGIRYLKVAVPTGSSYSRIGSSQWTYSYTMSGGTFTHTLKCTSSGNISGLTNGTSYYIYK